jgi:mannose-1-phosphate guanylyltransferase
MLAPPLRELERMPLASPRQPAAAPTAAPDVPETIRAVILLGGGVQQRPLVAASRRSVLSLPLGQGRCLLDAWRVHTLVLARRAGRDCLPVRLVIDRSTPAPELQTEDLEAGMSVELDPLELRGTGGVLRDLCADYAPDDYVVLVTAAQMMLEPLSDLVVELARTGGEVALVAHDDGTPSSLMLVRCGCLGRIPDVGFIDMKEQAIPLIARAHSVTVVRRERAVGLPIRNLPEYVTALRWSLAGHRADGPATVSPVAEVWRSSGAITDEGATVHPSAKLHDSVVLAGGCVQANAILVRSLVCPGATVARGRTVVDQIVTAR